ncbi:MAG: chlorophyll a/b-binding protein [Leptolyngbyaceae cyanobacterium MO_188.B28]|nr:chlorophyll a/b-binding protein [Leptolyngbyaceae cyanobacterium MO_188.B28]
MSSESNLSEQSPTSELSPEPVANQPEPAFGWTIYAEQLNGRFAMIGFVALLLLELFTRQDFFTWLGVF